jgi:hypothetical protein
MNELYQGPERRKTFCPKCGKSEFVVFRGLVNIAGDYKNQYECSGLECKQEWRETPPVEDRRAFNGV